MHVDLFFNPAAAAGRSGMRLGLAVAAFRELGAKVAMHRPSSADDASAALRALAGRSDRVVVVGGDGMVQLAANALAGSDTVLGVVAAGTGNDAATSLGLSTNVEVACRDALGDPLAIDLIEADGDRLAVTVATAGFSVAVNERADEMERLSSSVKYTVASLLELPKLRTHEMQLTLDGQTHQIEANLIAIANTQYFGGGMKIGPDADFTDGQLDVVVIGPASRRVFAAVLPMVFSGRHVRSRHVSTYRASTVELTSNDLSLRADGEPYATVPANLRVRSKALLVAGAQVGPG